MAGTITTNAVVLGDSATAANNFQLRTNTDGSMKLARGATGALGDILTVDASGNLANAGSPIQRMVTMTVNNGGANPFNNTLTSVDFTGIPSWAKRITLMFNVVSLSGTANLRIRLGSGSVDTTANYNCVSSQVGVSAAGSLAGASYTGFDLYGDAAAAELRTGAYVLTLLGSNIWTISGATASGGGAGSTTFFLTGSKTLSGALDRVRFTTSNGTDTYDGGSINVMYEG